MTEPHHDPMRVPYRRRSNRTEILVGFLAVVVITLVILFAVRDVGYRPPSDSPTVPTTGMRSK